MLEDLSIMNLFSVVENMTLETNSMTVSLLVNQIRNSKCRKKDLEQLELVRYSLFMLSFQNYKLDFWPQKELGMFEFF